MSETTGPLRSEQNSWGESLLGKLGDIGDSIVDKAGNLIGAGAAAGFAGIAADKATAGIDRAMGGVEDRYNTLQNNLAGSGTFKPYTVSSNSGTTSVNNGALSFNAGQRGLTDSLQSQAGTMGGNLGNGVAGLNTLGSQAFGGSSAALNNQSGAFATGLGNTYETQGQALLGSQVPQGINNLQTAFTTQGMQLPQTASEGLMGLTNQIQGLANTQLGQQSPDVSNTFAGLTAPTSSFAAGGLSRDAFGAMNFGDMGANVQGSFAGINAPNVRSNAGDLGQQALTQGQGMLGGGSPTAQGVYDQMRAMQSPEEERQRLALENRLFAQGRTGISTDAYGGTPEQFAMDKAQAEARNTASLQAMQTADTLASSQQDRAMQLSQLGLSAEQIQSQMDSEGFNQEMQLGQANLQEAQTQEGLQASAQQRQAQLAQLGLSGTQIQAQLDSEGFGQQLQIGQANLQAQQSQEALQSSAQARAAQLTQLGLSAEQIQSQLASEGLNRTTQAAQTAGQMAQIGSGIQGQQQQLGQGLLGLGLNARELGGQLGMQDLQQAQGRFGLGQQASMLPAQQQAAQLANIQGMLGTSYMPEQQLNAQQQQAMQMAQLAQSGQLAEMQASNNLGEANLQRYTELALGRATPDVQYINAVGNIGAGMFSGGKK
jgi:hypothetical protein